MKFVKTIPMWLSKIFFLLFLLVIPWQFVIGANSNLICRPKALKGHDCSLRLGENKIHIWGDKIFLNNGIERDTVTLPVREANADWEFIRGAMFRKNWVLEVAQWQPASTSSDVESLIWAVYEIEKGDWVKRVEKSIQKRKHLNNNKWKSDRRSHFGLKVKGQKTIWYVGQETGEWGLK